MDRAFHNAFNFSRRDRESVIYRGAIREMIYLANSSNKPTITTTLSQPSRLMDGRTNVNRDKWTHAVSGTTLPYPDFPSHPNRTVQPAIVTFPYDVTVEIIISVTRMSTRDTHVFIRGNITVKIPCGCRIIRIYSSFPLPSLGVYVEKKTRFTTW